VSVTKVTVPAVGPDELAARGKSGSPRYKTRSRSPAWRRRDRRAGYFYLLPAVALLGAFILYPLARVIQYSFQSWDGVGPATYVGFSNYEQLGQPPQSSALGHIGVLFIFFAIIPTALGLMVASLIGRVRMRGMSIFRVIFFLPQVIITVVIAIVWTWLLAPSGAGSINGILHALGLGPAVGPAYLGDFNTALLSLGLIALWVNFGLCFLLFLSGVQKISPELYDSARVDGAGLVREFVHITVPLLRREMGAVLIITTVIALQNFALVYVATNGGPGTSTIVPGILIYRDAFQLGEVGTAAALAVVLAALVAGVTLGIRALLERRAV
jgi:raffinose/stachyose/melibiose transport system permease protein